MRRMLEGVVLNGTGKKARGMVAAVVSRITRFGSGCADSTTCVPWRSARTTCGRTMSPPLAIAVIAVIICKGVTPIS